MNRRTAIKFLAATSLAFLSTPVFAQDSWVILGKRVLRPNLRTVSIAIGRELAGIAKLGIELKGSSIWLYNLRVKYQSGTSTIHPINLNIPQLSEGCSPRLSIYAVDERPQRVELDLECLPLTGKPTQILLWGTT